MKKSTLAMVCLLMLAMLASCKKKTETPEVTAPTISIFTSPNDPVYSGDEISIGFTLAGENLTKIQLAVTQGETSVYSHEESINNESAYSYTHTFVIEAIGPVTINGTVTDAQGQTATASIDITCLEKPNAKFVGHYEGDALINGIYNINITNMDPMHDTLVNQPLPTIVDIVAGDNMNEVTATVTINDQTNTVKGNVDGNKVVFEAINDTFTMHYDYSGMDIPITLDMTYDITGTLNGGTLDLEGNSKGSGEIHMFIINGTIEMEGVIGGSLSKTE